MLEAYETWSSISIVVLALCVIEVNDFLTALRDVPDKKPVKVRSGVEDSIFSCPFPVPVKGEWQYLLS